MKYTMYKTVNPWDKAKKFKSKKIDVVSKIIALIIVIVLSTFLIFAIETDYSAKLKVLKSESFYVPYEKLEDVYFEQDFFNYEESLIFHVASEGYNLTDILIDIDYNKDEKNHPYYDYIRYVNELESYTLLRDYVLLDKHYHYSEAQLRVAFIEDLRNYKKK